MTIISNLKKFALVAALVIGVASCSDDDDGNINSGGGDSDITIVANAQANSDLSILVQALERAELVDLLDGDTEYTVLAPDNEAFQSLLDSNNNWDSLEDIPVDDLKKILQYHVIGTPLTVAELSASGNAYTTTAAQYEGSADKFLSLYYNTDSGVVFNGASKVTTRDIEASNGVIHIIDEVLTIPTVATFVGADPTFSTLLSALTTLTPNTDLTGVLSAEIGDTGSAAPFTVFAPTNTAFTEFGEDNIPKDEAVLVGVLQAHVIAGQNVTSGDLSDGTVTTLNGDVTIDTDKDDDEDENELDATVKGSGNEEAIDIIAVDIQTSNGVVHAINGVILPEN